MTNTTTASKCIPRRTRISINWNPPFQTSLHKIFKNCIYEVMSQCLHLEVLLLSKFGSERGDFNWCRFWASWLCTYFDDVVAEVKTFLLLFRLALAILWDERNRIKSKSIGTQIEGKQPDRQVGRVGRYQHCYSIPQYHHLRVKRSLCFSRRQKSVDASKRDGNKNAQCLASTLHHCHRCQCATKIWFRYWDRN